MIRESSAVDASARTAALVEWGRSLGIDFDTDVPDGVRLLLWQLAGAERLYSELQDASDLLEPENVLKMGTDSEGETEPDDVVRLDGVRQVDTRDL